ncbi:hypothetical protein ACFQAT_07100 [Undibacterium arcticum]|uniref:hypothetical protein n=1 Tax=Undibacterium arcticum TaxID=1762892 RepID=UPI00361940D2
MLRSIQPVSLKASFKHSFLGLKTKLRTFKFPCFCIFKKFPPQKSIIKIEHTIVMRNNPGLGIVPTSDLGEDKLKPSR